MVSSLANSTFVPSTQSQSDQAGLTTPSSARNLTISSAAPGTTSFPATRSTAEVVSSSTGPPSLMTSTVPDAAKSTPQVTNSKTSSAEQTTPPAPGKAPVVSANPNMPSSTQPDKPPSTSAKPSSSAQPSPSLPNNHPVSSSPPASSSAHSSVTSSPPPPTEPPAPPKASSSTPPASPSFSTPITNHTPVSPTTTGTTTSVVVVHAPSVPTTSTITTQPDSTFAAPVAFTSTAANGTAIVTTPALITVISTSTEADGVAATFTHVVANPNFNGASQDLASSNNGFFHNQGAVAGVFVVVGIAVAAIVAGIFYCARRKRASNRRRRWLAGMQQQHPRPIIFSSSANPFQDPTFEHEHEPKTEPIGHSVDSHHDDSRWVRTSPDHLLGDGQVTRNYRALPQGPFTLYPDPYPLSLASSGNEPSSGYAEGRMGVSQAVEIPDRARFRHSYTPSTPSVYPATLAADEDVHFPAEVEPSKLLQREAAAPRESNVPVPPRPPRSHLRESAKYAGYAPPTPPTSTSSNSHDSNPPSPISEHRPPDRFTRRTLLDVRPLQTTN